MSKISHKFLFQSFSLISVLFISEVFASECDTNTNPDCEHQIFGKSVKTSLNSSQLSHNNDSKHLNASCYYSCNSSQDKCVSRDQVCDVIDDCPEGDDEHQMCDQLPKGSYCSFSNNDFCSWIALNNSPAYWATDIKANNQETLVVKYKTKRHEFGSSASIKSPLFKPIPEYHSKIGSKFYMSCYVRFLYLFASPSSEFLLEMNEKDPNYHSSGRNVELWRRFMTTQEFKHIPSTPLIWTRVSIPLPFNISNEYELVFSWSSSFRGISNSERNRQIVSLDNISLSKECFGIGVPENEFTPSVKPPFPGPGLPFDIPENASLKSFRLSSCGAFGRIGPNYKQCESFYANSNTRAAVIDSSSLPVNGTQMWTVPYTGYYVIFAKGAKGGHGLHPYSGGGNGALIRAVFKFQEGDTLFVLIGQPGTDACKDDNPSELRLKCDSVLRTKREGISKIRDLLNNNPTMVGGAGGGGGGTYVFKIENQNLVPLLIAGGGGGGGSDSSNTQLDKQLIKGHNGRGFYNFNKGSIGNGAEAGGGWFADPLTNRNTSGASLMSGAEGGYVCNPSMEWGTNGGFGGGGGGCMNGGAGGGYQGGDSYDKGRGGQGGTSYVNKQFGSLELFTVKEMLNANDSTGNGLVAIFPHIENCCNNGLYSCVITGQSVTKELNVQCICSRNHFEAKECLPDVFPSLSLIIFLSIAFIAGLLVLMFSVFYVFKYRKICNNSNHSGVNGRDASASQLLSNSSTDVQLSRLRSGHNIITEYNPNYEFGGSTCTLQDLREVPREKLTLIKALGQGAFGEVYQGFLHNMPGEITDELPVAVKTLPEYSANNQAEMDFLMEALIMSKFKHRNIVRFIGVCFEKMPRFIVLELLPGGDLKTFLRESRGTSNKPSHLVMGDILVIALDVALGCQYLEENHFIHRDIAARNCLLTSKSKSQSAFGDNVLNSNGFNICNYMNGFNNSGIVVKIADFGMARDIYRADYYRKGGKAMLPVKWMPPEAFLDGIFTSKTDVWSFGVLLWEVMSMGYMPYPGRGNQEVMQLVTAGGRLESPNPSTPSQVYAIMTQCWNPIPEQRPSFATIIERLGYCLQDPDVLNVKLPVFQRAPSMERDMTLMRPPPDATDYLVPNNPCSNSNSNYSMSTEKTELLSPDTCSTFSCSNEDNKLLELLDDVNPPEIPPRIGNWRESGFSDRSSNHSMTARSNGIKPDISAQPLLLDASALLQQPSRYMNVSMNDTSDAINSNNVKINC